MRSSMNLFIFFSLFVLFLNPKYMRPLLLSSSSETKFDSIPYGHLTFLGDSHLEYRAIALTREATRSAGVVFYSHPISFLDPHSKKVPSFYSMFAFSIQSMYGDEEAFGDGLAFLISPAADLLRNPGYMGLADSTGLANNKFIAIEFDTKRDSIFKDPDDNHVGLDINSLYSIKLAASPSLGVDLKSGNLITTWIEYKSNEKRLEVFLSKSALKPIKPLLKVDIDLSHYVMERMFVGFSCATGGSMQLTHIQQWAFKTMEFRVPPPPPPPPPPHSESGRIFANSSESRKHIHLSRFALAMTIAICFLPFVAFFGWFYWKKLMAMIQKSEGTNNLEMQTIRSSKGIPSQEILLSILISEVARGLNIQKLDNEAVKTVKCSIPLCNSLPLRTNEINSV